MPQRPAGVVALHDGGHQASAFTPAVTFYCTYGRSCTYIGETGSSTGDTAPGLEVQSTPLVDCLWGDAMNWVRLLLLVCVPFFVGTAQAVQVVLSTSNVIGSSGAYNLSFAASNVLDEQTGTVSDTFGSTYWLNPDNSPAQVYITIDLGSAQVIGSFDIFNTHNDSYNDRGTGAFQIVGSNTVVLAGAGNMRVSGGTVLVSSSLTNSIGTPVAQSFSSSSAIPFRYISFEPLTALSPSGPAFSTTAYGLNEIRVFAVSVPEAPTSLMLLSGAILGISLLRRRSIV